MIHCTDILSQTPHQFESINIYHRDFRNFPKSSLNLYGGYTRLIHQGKLYTYRTDYDEQAHCNDKVDGVSMNFQSIGIAWGGDGDIEMPSAQDLALIRQEVQFYMGKYNISVERVVPHRKYNKTGKTCPGVLLTDDWIRSLTVQKSDEQKEKQQEIQNLTQQVSLLQKLLDLLKRLSVAMK